MAMVTKESSSPDELYQEAAEKIVKQMKLFLDSKGSCFLGIVGGRTIPALLEKIVPLGKDLPGRTDVFWLDERIPSEKNYQLAEPALTKLRGKMVQIFWHPLKATSVDEAKQDANKILRHMDKLNRKREFDVVILSAGEDGHIASLFPGKKNLNETEKGYIITPDAPKPPPERITASAPFILTAKHAHLFFVGEKQKAYINFLDPSVNKRECPAKILNQLPDLTIHVCLNK